VNDDILQEIWDKERKEPKMSRAEIQAVLRPHVRKNAFGLRFLVWIYMAFIAGTLVVQGMAIYAFRTNPVFLTVHAVLTALTLGILGYGIHLSGELGAMDRGDESLVAVLRRRLRFYRTKYEIWLWMLALTLVFLTLAVTTTLDNQDGQYRINRPAIFICFTIAQFLFAYAIFKAGHYPLLRELKAILSDLEHQVTTGTERIKDLKKTWRLWSVLLVILGTILLILGIFRALGWPG
jgi:hypothetical protein